MQVSSSVIENTRRYAEAFSSARPFKHTVIDNFFDPDFAERLLADFPRFNPALAKNEIYGGVWGKAVNTSIREISSTYQEMYELMTSATFLALMSEISGIPDLLADPRLYGGGTHENLHGQDLDPHVDFNYDEARNLHRRLNLIVYLNKDWKPEWGGSLEIHSNPRRTSENEILSYCPVFNRAVIFETNERSWHGFPRIELPESERHRSRKSISIYLYTRSRPTNEIAPPHGTFYVHRPLPPRFQPGYTLTGADHKDLLFEMDRRDKWIEKYQAMELANSGELQEKNTYIQEILARVRAPLTGEALQEGLSKGLYADGWAASHATFNVRPTALVTSIAIRGWRPRHDSQAVTVTLEAAGQRNATVLEHEAFELVIPLDSTIDSPFSISVECSPSLLTPGDHRELSFMLLEVRIK